MTNFSTDLAAYNFFSAACKTEDVRASPVLPGRRLEISISSTHQIPVYDFYIGLFICRSFKRFDFSVSMVKIAV